jgi:hypothetical protein
MAQNIFLMSLLKSLFAEFLQKAALNEGGLLMAGQWWGFLLTALRF